ncbi:MAG: branched-chain amino acid ABC transporter permease [Deltaproteobacteria bacterium]|nr:branched-chain amino acid ABC transporter permease [Deltaproteobacteria bacterium]
MYLPCGTFNENYISDNAIIRTRSHILWCLAGLAFSLLILLSGNTYLIHFATLVGITIIAALGLQILTGYAGLFSIAHAAFMAVGAYSSAILASHGVPLFLSLPAAAIVAGMVGLIFGLPSLRIKGFYLLMATFAAQFIIMYIITHWQGLTKGEFGYPAPSPIEDERAYFILVLVCLIAFTIATKNILRSKAGRALVAINNNDLAAEVMGISLYRYKLLAFFISCMYAGFAGGLYAHFYRMVMPEAFSLHSSMWFLGYLLVGGLGSVPGAYFGVILILGLNEVLTNGFALITNMYPEVMRFLAPLRQVIFGVVVILFLLFEPRGLANSWEKLKKYLQLWPYPYWP